MHNKKISFFNEQNKFVKKFFRFMKDKHHYNSEYLSMDRFLEVICKQDNYIDSILYNFDIPNLLIPTEVKYNSYKFLHMEFIKTYLDELLSDIIKIYSLEKNDEIIRHLKNNIISSLNGEDIIKNIILHTITKALNLYNICNNNDEVYKKLTDKKYSSYAETSN